MSKRLDIALSQHDNVKSRTISARLIKEGKVSVNKKIVKKPSFLVNESDLLEIVGELPKYVSRGGIKLEYALNYFFLSVKGRICLDVGASTGGFTHCLLVNGAELVYSVDVGTMQLSEEIRKHERVVSLENLDIRKADKIIPCGMDFACVDVSFISLTQILVALKKYLKPNADIVALVKPQFEVGRECIGKNGIVKSEKARLMAVNKIISFSELNGYKIIGKTTSPITGGDGNVEYLLHLCVKQEE